MNLTSPSQVKSWCIEHEFHPNKVLGQNFLIDRNVLEAIVDTGIGKGEEARGKRVLEVGPGLGVLTSEMLQRGAQVVAIEKDPVLAERLQQETFPNKENLELIAGDALAVIKQERIATRSFDAMVSNLPYQAGTRILLDMVITRQFPEITVLVQSEVAERLAAKEGSKVRGLAGVWAQLDYDVQVVRKVAASCFWPRPEIGSSVVKLTRHYRNDDFSEEERRFFRNITKKAFEHRRKQLGSIFKDMIQSTARAEELGNNDWITLTKGLVHENT